MPRRTPHPLARLLVVEDDPDTLESIALVLRDEGYDVTACASHASALELVDSQTFAFILTDLFYHPNRDALASARELLAHAHPTPVAVVTAWQVYGEEVTRQGFACLIRKPFDVGFLLTSVASRLCVPLTPRQARRAARIRDFFAALGAGDLHELARLCAPDVRYTTPKADAQPLVIEGISAYCAYVAARRADFPCVHFEDVFVYALPRRLAARYTMCWRQPDKTPTSVAGTACFQFAGDCIAQIALELSPVPLRRAAAAAS